MAMTDKSRGANSFPRNVKLAVGETITGHVTGFDESTKYPGSFFIQMRLPTGENVSLGANGNLKYRHKDGDIVVGQLTTITRNADVLGKKSKKMAANYYLGQDPENTIEVASELDEAGITSDVADAKPVSSIKERAAKLQVKS